MAVSQTSWVSEEEKRMVFPCDELGIDFDQSCSLLRGITVNASPEILYKWLNQLQYGPYSYDWLDNPGRRSPQYLVEDNPSLKPGKPVIEMFTLASIELDRHFTAVMKPNFFPGLKQCAMTCLIEPHDNQCRLLVKINIIYKKSPVGFVMRWLLPWGDVIMMGKQLRNLKRLVEKT